VFAIRFPREVTLSHPNAVVRNFASEINITERQIRQYKAEAEEYLVSIGKSLESGQPCDLLATLHAALLNLVLSAERRDNFYYALAEAIGDSETYEAFLAEYPPVKEGS